ncbi:MAG: DegT/DnrJ/EryC1/StrS family aminotransferase [Candidatus Omnitrophica bacterium]|nr:DegT/DnrJ/EryC1/StrS family aminotransferase [Candidatus Omnitrophota bacterium]
MKITFSDLNAQHQEIKKEISRAIAGVMKRGDFILGQDVSSFENEFAAFCGAKYAVGVSSGTSALFLALLALGVGNNDEVIVPSFTYIATAAAVSYTGAKPVFVDIREDTYNIDVAKLEEVIIKNTKASIPFHIYGQPAEMPKILAIAKRHDLKVIEDAAQAHGAKIKMPSGIWESVGNIGDAGCFSFYPSKNLGGFGDGGLVVTNDPKIRDKTITLRNCGRKTKYDHVVLGYNARLDTLQAAILRVKLEKLNAWNHMRQNAAKIYNKYLGGVKGVITPHAAPDVQHVYHVYAIRIKNRDEVFRELKARGVDAIIHYPIPVHLQKAYENLGYKKGDCPVSEKIAGEIISLPMFPHLKEKQIKYIASILKNAMTPRAKRICAGVHLL